MCSGYVRERAHSLSSGGESNLINQARKIASGAPSFQPNPLQFRQKKERKKNFVLPLLSQEVRMVRGRKRKGAGGHINSKTFGANFSVWRRTMTVGRTDGTRKEMLSLSLPRPFSCRKNRELSDLAEGKRKEEGVGGNGFESDVEGWVAHRRKEGERGKWGSTERVCLIASSIGKVSRIVTFLLISLCVCQGFLKNVFTINWFNDVTT